VVGEKQAREAARRIDAIENEPSVAGVIALLRP
jgi:hypothetical protein